MVAPATVGFLELLVFFFAPRFTMILRLDSFFAVRFLAGDFRFATRLRETAFFAVFRFDYLPTERDEVMPQDLPHR